MADHREANKRRESFFDFFFRSIDFLHNNIYQCTRMNNVDGPVMCQSPTCLTRPTTWETGYVDAERERVTKEKASYCIWLSLRKCLSKTCGSERTTSRGKGGGWCCFRSRVGSLRHGTATHMRCISPVLWWYCCLQAHTLVQSRLDLAGTFIIPVAKQGSLCFLLLLLNKEAVLHMFLSLSFELKLRRG